MNSVGFSIIYLFLLALILSLIQCKPFDIEPPFNIALDTHEEFHHYWYSGKAEITTYRLSQSQYGEQYEGVLTTIFVTEDFNLEKGVKSDSQSDTFDHIIPVLKMIQEKRFLTGIYPYTKMVSVFSPLTGDQSGRAVKINSSATEWCGQTFSQWTGNPKQWEMESFSYFERQGDQKKNFERVWHEDEVWSVIRLAPEHLPLDTFSIIQGNFNLRDRVARAEMSNAVGQMLTESDSSMVYQLFFLDTDRTLSIEFLPEFPHLILGWTDVFFRHEQQIRHTVERYKSMQIDYWNYNSNRYEYLYSKLMPESTVFKNEIINN